MVISFFMSIPQNNHIIQFINYLKFQKRYSIHTLTAYEKDLSSFEDYLKEKVGEEDLVNVAPALVRSWLATLKGENISSRSINRKISSLKSFYKYLMKEGVIVAGPMEQVISPKIKKRLPQFVAKEEMNVLFNTVEFSDDFRGETERLVLQILYESGIRRAELISLKEQHIDFANSTIKVLGKGSKERIIPVGNALLASMRKYLEDKIQLPYEANRLVFLVNEHGKPLTGSYVYKTVKKYLGMITTIEKKSPHILRHSFATHLTGDGADLNAVKELLGHSSLAATQVYTHNNIQKLKDIHKKAHPKS